MNQNGLLGLLGVSSGDPSKDAALNHGLLTAGLALMQSRGRLGPALGQAGMAGLMGYQQAQQQQFQQQFQQQQIEDMKAKGAERDRQAKIRDLAPQFLKSTKPDFMDERDIGQPGEPALPKTFDYAGYSDALAGLDPVQALQIKQATQKSKTPIKLGEGDVLIDPEHPSAPIASNPKAAKPEQLPEALRALAHIYGEGSPQYQAAARKYAEKLTTHTPGVSVSYGAPLPAVNPQTGEVELFRPDNRGGMSPTGIKPPPQDRDVKLPAELQRMQIAGDTMVSLLDDYEGMLRKHNPRDPSTQMNPAVRAEIQTLKRNMELQFKELQALGALAGPDVEIMRQALADPFSVSGAFYGREGLLAQTKRARELVQLRKDAVLKSQGKSAKPAAAPAVDDPLGLRGR